MARWIVYSDADRTHVVARLVGEACPLPHAFLDDGSDTRDVWAPSVSPPIREIRTLAWVRRLSPQRWAAINVAAVQAAAAGNGALLAAIQQLTASQQIDMDDPDVTAGVAAWVGLGLLTQADADALTADGRPEET